MGRLARGGRDWLIGHIGGPARTRVVIVLAAVLALDGADAGTVSATASNLKAAFGINNTDIGLLVTASTLTGAVMTIPIGALTDRVRRTRLLGLSILLWAAAVVLGALSQSYLWLVLSRVALGAVTATAGPTVASLTGDYFPAEARARMYGFILGGELVGTGVGYGVSGFLAGLAGWRYAFGWLLIPSALLGYLMLARLAEPARGGQSRLSVGQEYIPDVDEVADEPPQQQQAEEQQALEEGRDDVTARAIERHEVKPYESQVLTEDPANKGLWWAVKYVLRVRTDVVIIVSSALGYFYFAGLRTFAILFAQDHYGVSKTEASGLVLVVGAGALVGVYAGGRATDRLRDRGILSARVVVPVVVLLALPIFLGPGFWASTLWIALPLLTVGAGLLGAANPPQDAARLDIIHPHLWGRSEGVRTALRRAMEAAGPVAFGVVSDRLFGGNISYGVASGGGARNALAYTFIVFLGLVVIAGLVVLIALRTYPRDVVTADASVRNTIGDTASEKLASESIS